LVVTGYIFFGLTVEERDLKNALGPEYIAYRKRTPMLIPFLKFGKGDTTGTESTD
jgi:protein-S-isoprenylcysteine O-methyltransferase Ste14